MLKPRYILLKESPELKKGAILEANGCIENGNYKYNCKDLKSLKNAQIGDYVEYGKDRVEKQPKWFKKVSPLWITDKELKKIKKFLKED